MNSTTSIALKPIPQLPWAPRLGKCSGAQPHALGTSRTLLPWPAQHTDKSELWALSPQSPWEHKLGVSSPCSLMPVWPPLALWCLAMTAAWAGRAAAVSPHPASLLPGSRVSSRARLCRPLAPGSGFLLQLPAALTAPRLEAASSSMEAGSLAQPAPKQPKVMGLAGAVGQDLGSGQLERESLNPGCCCDSARVWDLKRQNLGLDSAMGAVPVVNCVCWEPNSFQSHPGVPSFSRSLTGLQPLSPAQLPSLSG